MKLEDLANWATVIGFLLGLFGGTVTNRIIVRVKGNFSKNNKVSAFFFSNGNVNQTIIDKNEVERDEE